MNNTSKSSDILINNYNMLIFVSMRDKISKPTIEFYQHYGACMLNSINNQKNRKTETGLELA